MANYAPWWDSTITIYNRYEDMQTNYVKWFRFVVDGAFWKNTNNKVTIGQVTIDSDSVICRIRENAKYKPPYEWANLPNDEMENYFTLNVGDIIIKGEVEDEIDEYIKGKRSSDLLSKYKVSQGCVQIQSVGDNTGSIRNEPHYYVSGK